MPYGNISRALNNEGNMSGTLTIQPTTGGGVSDVLMNGESVVTDHKAYVNIEVEQTVTEGKKIAGVIVNGNNTDILIPEIKIYDDASGDLITIEDAMEAPLEECKVALEPQQAGTGDPSPSNVRPISGWDEVNVTRCGVNIWDEEWEVGAISNSNGGNYALAEKVRSKNYISVKPNTPYYLYLPNTYSSARIACYDKDRTYLGQATGWLSVNNNTAFTTPSNTFYIRFVVVKTDETYNNDISINYPSTDTEYHAYNGHTYTIDLNGTRYGGELDVVNGVMTVDRVYVDLGDLNWTYRNGFFRTTDLNATIKRPANNNTKANVISSMYTVETWNAITNTDNGKFALSAGATDPLLVCNTSFTDATSFKTAMSGVQLVYKLATPQEIQLTPTEVTLLRGINNIWSDGEMYVKWRVDAEMLLQSIIDNR